MICGFVYIIEIQSDIQKPQSDISAVENIFGLKSLDDFIREFKAMKLSQHSFKGLSPEGT